MNLDGQTDFEIINDGFEISVMPIGGNRVGVDERSSAVLNISEGFFIGETWDPPGEWEGIRVIVGIEFPLPIQTCGANGAGVSCSGDFVGTEGFFGVEFDIDGATHYGWVRAVGDPGFVYMTFLDWAYESEPGIPIAAGAVPEPTGALLMALGAGLLALRRRR